jgi:HemY protein
VSGRIDAFEWKVPLAQIEQAGAGLDLATETPLLVEEKPPAAPEAVAPGAAQDHAEKPSPAAVVAPPLAAGAPARRTRVSAEDIVLPTAPVPDDPGPDPDLEREPRPEPTSASSGWRRFFSW